MQLPEGPICQSCSMPLQKPEHFGTEASGAPSAEYCCFCYQQGRFTDPNRTLDDMVKLVAGFLAKEAKLAEPEARAQATVFVSKLKRWAK